MMMPAGQLKIIGTFSKAELRTAMSFVISPALIGPALIGPFLGSTVGWCSLVAPLRCCHCCRRYLANTVWT